MPRLTWIYLSLVFLCSVIHRASAENFVPRESPLRKAIKVDDKNEKIRGEILKLIPIGTSEAATQELFKKHMPPKEMPTHELRASDIPEKFQNRILNKKYRCFRLLEEGSWSPPGRQWIEVLFFFEEGLLQDVYVARWGVVA